MVHEKSNTSFHYCKNSSKELRFESESRMSSIKALWQQWIFQCPLEHRACLQTHFWYLFAYCRISFTHSEFKGAPRKIIRDFTISPSN